MKNGGKILIVHHGVYSDGVYITVRENKEGHEQNNKLTKSSKYIPFRFRFSLV